MAMTTFTVTHSRAGDYQGAEDMSARNAAGRIVNFLSGCASGAYGATTLAVSSEPATAAITVDNFTGSTITYIGGTELPEVDAAGTDELTAAAIGAVINDPANGVSDAVTATVQGNVVVLVAVVPGAIGNFVSIGATGTGITVSSPTLLGGTTTTYTF